MLPSPISGPQHMGQAVQIPGSCTFFKDILSQNSKVSIEGAVFRRLILGKRNFKIPPQQKPVARLDRRSTSERLTLHFHRLQV